MCFHLGTPWHYGMKPWKTETAAKDIKTRPVLVQKKARDSKRFICSNGGRMKKYIQFKLQIFASIRCTWITSLQKKTIHSNNSPNIHQATKVHPLPKLSAPLVLSWQKVGRPRAATYSYNCYSYTSCYVKNMPSSHVIST